MWQEYQLLLEHLRVPPTVHMLTGSGMNFMIGRVSYTFGLQGALLCLQGPIYTMRACLEGSQIYALWAFS